MAKNQTVQVLLRHSVVLGEGTKARTEPAGTLVTVTSEIADELIASGAAAPPAAAAEEAAPPKKAQE